MSDSRWVHAISLCLSEWTNNCALCVFLLCFRGAGGTTGTTGRATMSNTAEWMTWCCSARSMRTPSWTISRRDTWMTTSLYPSSSQSQFTPQWGIAAVPSQPCYSQNSWMVIHSVIVAMSNRPVLEVNAFPWASVMCRGGKGPLCSPQPDLSLLLILLKKSDSL